jgi:hypothetical protein
MNGPYPSLRFLTRSGEWPAELAAMEQALARLGANVAVAVAKFGKRGCGERDLAEWRQALVDEPLQPAQRRSFVARRIGVRQELAQQKRVGK